MVAASVLLIATCLITAFLPVSNPNDPNYIVILPLLFLGISYSFYGPIQDSVVSYIVPANMLGTAFGINAVIYNVGMFGSPLIAGETLKTDKKNGYFWTMMYFTGLLIISTIVNVIIYIDD